MKKNIIKIVSMMLIVATILPITVQASTIQQSKENLLSMQSTEFENLISEILNIKEEHPEYTEKMILQIMNERHPQIKDSSRGIIDIWNALTDSEKKLCIRYPFDALKVNTARNIATEQTDRKFGYSGLGDRSDAFRHGIWNAEMTVLIGKEKAELFATAHEDKDVTGNESDGYPKTAHRDMDLHNNEVGRAIGEQNKDVSEDEMADIIYQDIFSETTQFVWLHE